MKFEIEICEFLHHDITREYLENTERYRLSLKIKNDDNNLLFDVGGRPIIFNEEISIKMWGDNNSERLKHIGELFKKMAESIEFYYNKIL